MNNSRRKEIQYLIDQIEVLKGEVEQVSESEQEYIDNMPENLQEGERFQIAEEAVSVLDYALDNLQEAIDNLTESTN